MAAIEMLYDLALGDFRPDLTLILNIPVETGMEEYAAAPATRTATNRWILNFTIVYAMGFFK